MLNFSAGSSDVILEFIVPVLIYFIGYVGI